MSSPHSDADETLGFNSDVSYRNLVYHVQTETLSGLPHTAITTLVYLRGTLVTKVSTACEFAPGDSPRDALPERVKRQHQSVLNRVQKGEFAR